MFSWCPEELSCADLGHLLSQVSLRLFHCMRGSDGHKENVVKLSMKFLGSPSNLPSSPKCRHWYWLPQSLYNILIYVVFKCVRFFFCLYFPDTYTHTHTSILIHVFCIFILARPKYYCASYIIISSFTLKCVGCTPHKGFFSTERTSRRTPRSRIVTRQQIHNLQDGAELYEAIQNASDPGYMEVTKSYWANFEKLVE